MIQWSVCQSYHGTSEGKKKEGKLNAKEQTVTFCRVHIVLTILYDTLRYFIYLTWDLRLA